MNIQNILSETKHRPWEMPHKRWRFYQEWNDAVFLHWQVELDQLRRFIPEDLEIDLFEGKPWVSLVAFTMENIRPRYLPSFSPISCFDEINVRTYVKSNNKTGVYFLSIEGGTSLSCSIAKAISELPYRYSKMKRTDKGFISTNKELNESLNIEFSIGDEIVEKSELDKWLTERYALFQDTRKSINEFEIHHVERALNAIKIENIDLNYARFNDLFNGQPDKVHYSSGVKVLAWSKTKRVKGMQNLD